MNREALVERVRRKVPRLEAEAAVVARLPPVRIVGRVGVIGTVCIVVLIGQAGRVVVCELDGVAHRRRPGGRTGNDTRGCEPPKQKCPTVSHGVCALARAAYNRRWERENGIPALTSAAGYDRIIRNMIKE